MQNSQYNASSGLPLQLRHLAEHHFRCCLVLTHLASIRILVIGFSTIFILPTQNHFQFFWARQLLTISALIGRRVVLSRITLTLASDCFDWLPRSSAIGWRFFTLGHVGMIFRTILTYVTITWKFPNIHTEAHIFGTNAIVVYPRLSYTRTMTFIRIIMLCFTIPLWHTTVIHTWEWPSRIW